ncbi:MAG: IscS subfamily cysteine desulfurase [Proteobacteria bacterium]|nr:MAG: IscS subfamily cysteine desulfurase [Pseudomonadota bacterium]
MIYLDHQSTTPTDARVVEAMLPYFDREFGNAASRTHAFGWRAEAAVELARESIARALGAAEPREIVFTSGATESNNLAILGAARAGRARGDHLVTVATEHSAVLEPCQALAREGFRVTVLPVDRDGLVDPDAVAAALDDRTLLVSVMAANNEIGVLQPIEAIGALCRARGVLFHTDAAQALGKVALDVAAAGVDLLSCTAHKLHGPKGIGALYVRGGRPRVRLEPLLHGGGHERGLRPGTLPVPLVVGFGRAVEIAEAERAAEQPRLAALRDRLLARLDALGGVALNGHRSLRLAGNANVAIDGVEADALLAALHDVALSAGSACTSARPEPSHVLRALGLPDAAVRSSVRIGLGRGTTEADVDAAAARIAEEVRALRAARPAATLGRLSP